MRKRLRIDIKQRKKFFNLEFKNTVLKYLSINSDECFLKKNILKNQNELHLVNIWKNKSFKLRQPKMRINSKIRNYCIISGRARGLSKNYFSLSRNSFKHLQSIGLLPGVFKFN